MLKINKIFFTKALKVMLFLSKWRGFELLKYLTYLKSVTFGHLPISPVLP